MVPKREQKKAEPTKLKQLATDRRGATAHLIASVLLFVLFFVLRALIIFSDDSWYMDDGSLSKEFCEQQSESLDGQPDILDKCCACNEAKYEIIFEGLWSKNTHAKEFPTGNVTHFGEIIGASHTADFRMWDYGGYASEGFRQLAESGVTKKVEAELKAESNKIR